VSYASSNTAVATIVGSNIHIVGVGTATITASQAGDTNYNTAPNVTQTLTVNKANQTITFGALPAKTFGDADFAPGATASSGLAVSYASSNTAVATIVGSNIHIVGVGTATITASQAGDTNYNAAPNVTQTLTVNKATTTTAITSAPPVAYGVDASVTITVTSWLQQATGNVTLTMDGTKSYVGTVTGTGGTVTITIPAADLTLGSHALQAQYAGDTNFLGSNAYGSLSVGQAVTTTVIDAPTITYGSNGSVTVTVSSGAGTPTGSVSLTVDGSTTTHGLVNGSSVFTITNPAAGSHTLNATYAAQGSFQGSSAPGTLTVNTAALTVTANNASKTYGAANPAFTASYSGFVNGEGPGNLGGTLTFSTPATQSSPVGTYTITPSGYTSTNYTITYATGNLTVIRAVLTVTANDASKTYGSPNPAFTASYSGFVNGEGTGVLSGSPSLTTTATTTSPVGTYPIVAAQGTLSAANYSFNFVNGTLTITGGASQTITFNPLPVKTFGDADFAPGATASSGLAVSYTSSNTAVATIVSGNIHIVGAGSATITANQPGDGTYNAAPPVSQTLTVNKANQTITFGALPAKTFGNADFAPGATASSGLAVSYTSLNTAVATIVGSNIHIVGAGSATITASQAGNANYNAAPDVSQTLTVNKAATTTAITSAPPVALGVDASVTITVTSWLQQATGNVTLTMDGTQSYVGTVTGTGGTVTITIPAADLTLGSHVLQAQYAGDTNFLGSDAYGSLNVGQAATTTVIDAPTITYGSNGSVTVTVSSGAGTPTGSVSLTVDGSTTTHGLVNGSSVFTITNPAAGSHTLNATYAAQGNFGASSASGTLTVNKAALTVTANNASKTYGDANPAFTASYSGFVNGEGPGNLGGTLTFSTPATQSSPVGSYAITPSGYTSSNYAITYVAGTLTIIKANQTITFNPLPSKTVGDADFAPGATASSGLAVSYTSSNTLVATIVGSNIHIVGAGSATITASQSGNTNYNAAADVQQILTVNKANQTITFNPLPTKTFGDADFAPGATASSGLAVSYTSSNTSVATIAGSNIHIVGAGWTTITASQGGNANYYAALDVQQTLTVNPANQTITFSSLPVKTFGDADFAPGATASSGLAVSYTSSNTSVATIVGSNIHIVGAGSATITASQAGNTNYNAAADVQHTLTVNKANQTITFGSLGDSVVGDPPFTLGATASSGLTVSYTSSDPNVATVSGSTVTIVGAGTTTITASQSGNANYNAALDVQQSLTVNPGP
jgi:hypothetical protein